MKKLLLIIFISLTFINCKHKSVENELDISRIQEINEIVEAIIIQDSLNIMKNEKGTALFCVDLLKLNIEIPEKRKDGLIPPPNPFNSVLFEKLLKTKINDEMVFSKKDSLTLIMQNTNPQKIRISDGIISKINSTTQEKELKKREKGNIYKFYEMNIPIFSLDKSKAYVEIGYYCRGLCGSGKAIYLKKMNGKWKIVDTWRTWIS